MSKPEITVIRADILTKPLSSIPLCQLDSRHDAHATSAVSMCSGVTK